MGDSNYEFHERLLMVMLGEQLLLKRYVHAMNEYISENDGLEDLTYAYNERYIKEKKHLKELLEYQIDLLEKVESPPEIIDGKRHELDHVFRILSESASGRSNPFKKLTEGLDQSYFADILNISTNYVNTEEPYLNTDGIDSEVWKLILMEI
jgi:hypothetical protein